MAVGVSGFLALAVASLLIGLTASDPDYPSCTISWFVWFLSLFNFVNPSSVNCHDVTQFIVVLVMYMLLPSLIC